MQFSGTVKYLDSPGGSGSVEKEPCPFTNKRSQHPSAGLIIFKHFSFNDSLYCCPKLKLAADGSFPRAIGIGSLSISITCIKFWLSQSGSPDLPTPRRCCSDRSRTVTPHRSASASSRPSHPDRDKDAPSAMHPRNATSRHCRAALPPRSK